MKSFFFNPEERRIRALWRIALQILLMFAIVGVPIYSISEVATWCLKSGVISVSHDLFDKLMDVIVGITMTGLVLFSLFLSSRWLDHREFRAYGFHLNASWWKKYALGFALGSSLMGLIFIVEYFSGWVTITGYVTSSVSALPLWFAFLYPLIKASCVGTYEEAISRGYQFTNLREGFTGVRGISMKTASLAAILITSTIFGALHILNPNAGILSTITIIFNGAMFATAFMLTGELSMSIGLHMAWNLTQGVVFGFPVSGDPEISMIIQTHQSGPEWITGGAFGPEGGMLGLGASCVGIAVLLVIGRRRE